MVDLDRHARHVFASSGTLPLHLALRQVLALVKTYGAEFDGTNTATALPGPLDRPLTEGRSTC